MKKTTLAIITIIAFALEYIVPLERGGFGLALLILVSMPFAFQLGEEPSVQIKEQ